MAIQTDERLAGITQYIMDEVPNGLEKKSAFLSYVTKEGKKKRDGGVKLQFPVKLLENESSGCISGTGDLVDMTPSQQLQYGELAWKAYYFGVNFTLMDYAKAGGENDKIDFIETKVEGALEDSYNELSTLLHGTNVSAPLNFNGLKDIVAASGTAYAGLTDTDYATGAYLPHIATDTTLSFLAVQRMINKVKARAKVGKDLKYFGLMNDGLYSKYQGLIQNQQMAVNTNSLFDTGFEGFKINHVEFYLDSDCPGTNTVGSADNYLYILPMKHLQFHYIYGLGTPSPLDGEQKVPNGTVKSAQHFLVGNLVCNNRRAIAVCKTFTV